MTLSHGQMEPLQVGSAASEVRRHTPRDWIRSFDLIRASAVMLVVFAHGRVLLPQLWRGDYWFAPAHWGIELFFALSGYLITGQAIKLATASSWKASRNFFMRRFLRTLPLYWLVILVTGLFMGTSPQDILANAFFLPTLPLAPQGPAGLIPVTWSLAIEEASYLLIGLSATTIGRFLPSDCDRRSAVCFRLAVLHLSLIIMMLVARWVACRNGFGFEQIKASTVLQLDALSYGGLAAIVLVHPSLRRWFSFAASPPPARIGSMILALLSTILAMMGLGLALRFGFLLLQAKSQFQNSTLILSQLVVAGQVFSRITCAIFILLAALVPMRTVMLSNRRRWKLLVDIPASSSYSLYLVHLPILGAFRSPGTLQALPNTFLIYMFSSLLAGWLLYVVVEIPILNLRNRFREASPGPG